MKRISAELPSARGDAVVVLVGKERFIVDRIVTDLCNRLLDGKANDFNLEKFSAKEITPTKIVETARTLPMFARRKVVVVRDVEEWKADALPTLLAYVEKPAPETCLILAAEKLDQRTKFFSALKKQAEIVKCDPLPERRLPAVVRLLGEERGLLLPPDVITDMIDALGTDLGLLVDWVNRFVAYLNISDNSPARSVSAAEAEPLLGTLRPRSVFELVEAIGVGDRSEALKAVRALMMSKEPAIKIVALLARHARQLMELRRVRGRRMPPGEIASLIGVPPFAVDKLVRQADRLSDAGVREYHRAVYWADRTLKSSRLGDERVLERLIWQLT